MIDLFKNGYSYRNICHIKPMTYNRCVICVLVIDRLISKNRTKMYTILIDLCLID